MEGLFPEKVHFCFISPWNILPEVLSVVKMSFELIWVKSLIPFWLAVIFVLVCWSFSTDVIFVSKPYKLLILSRLMLLEWPFFICTEVSLDWIIMFCFFRSSCLYFLSSYRFVWVILWIYSSNATMRLV